MTPVIEALERQLRLEKAAITANNIERDMYKSLPGYKGPAFFPERPEYIKELEDVIKLLQDGDVAYWKKRCEAAEDVINVWDGNFSPAKGATYNQWVELKNKEV